MGKFLVEHAEIFLIVFGSLISIVGFFIVKWMNQREAKELYMKKEMAAIRNNYLDRFEKVTANQNENHLKIVERVNDFQSQISARIADLSNKLDNKHEPLKEKIEELLKKFD